MKPGQDGLTAAQRHLAAISAGTVTKTNVIGIRKAINHIERIGRGWSGNRSNVTIDEVFEIEQALHDAPPLVTGGLHATGLKQLRDPRYAKRFNETQRGIIERDDATFSLVRYDRIGRQGMYAVPVYRMAAPRGYHERPNGAGWTTGGEFLFRNIPWQAVFGSEEYQSGPEVMED